MSTPSSTHQKNCRCECHLYDHVPPDSHACKIQDDDITVDAVLEQETRESLIDLGIDDPTTVDIVITEMREDGLFDV